MLFSNHISRFQSDPDTRIGKYFNESRCLATFKPYPLPMTTKKTSQGVRPSIISVPSRAPEFLFFFNSFFFSEREASERELQASFLFSLQVHRNREKNACSAFLVFTFKYLELFCVSRQCPTGNFPSFFNRLSSGTTLPPSQARYPTELEEAPCSKKGYVAETRSSVAT